MNFDEWLLLTSTFCKVFSSSVSVSWGYIFGTSNVTVLTKFHFWPILTHKVRCIHWPDHVFSTYNLHFIDPFTLLNNKAPKNTITSWFSISWGRIELTWTVLKCWVLVFKHNLFPIDNKRIGRIRRTWETYCYDIWMGHVHHNHNMSASYKVWGEIQQKHTFARASFYWFYNGIIIWVVKESKKNSLTSKISLVECACLNWAKVRITSLIKKK